MKFSLTLRPRRALTRSEAKACLAANVALPGAGSLAAGRAVGYWQMAATFIGFIVTLVTGIPMVQFCLANWGHPADSQSDPAEFLLKVFHLAFWPVVGIGIFTGAMLWSIITAMQLISEASDEGVPPRIDHR